MRLSALALTAFLVLGTVPEAITKEEVESLSVALRLAPAEVRLAEKVRLDVFIENTGKVDFEMNRVLRWGHGVELVLEVRDAAGAIVERGYIDEGILDPMPDDRIMRLAPRHFLGTVRNMRASAIASKPGRYQLKVLYRRSLPGRSDEVQYTESNECLIEIKP